MKKVLAYAFKWYNEKAMSKKISISFWCLLMPLFIVLAVWFHLVYTGNTYYSKSIENTSKISEISLDFKKNYDYKIYLIIVGNKTPSEENPIKDLESARDILMAVKNKTTNTNSLSCISTALNYLKNLEKYTLDVIDKAEQGGNYDVNKDIWEKDIQSITSAVQDQVLELLYYENEEAAFHYRDIQQTVRAFFVISVIVAILMIVFAILMSTKIPKSITQPVSKLSKITKQVAGGDLSVRAEVNYGPEIRTLAESLNTMIVKINSLIGDVKTEQIRLREYELQLLQSQINPHFLYNTLDTIVWLAEGGDSEGVVNMVETLSEFFRASLNGGKDIVSLESEQKHISSYLEIQKVRYQDILDYSIDIPSELDGCSLPKISLQPLVENALYHGIKNKRRPGIIRVSAKREGGDCVIYVEDDGIGIDEERISQIHDKLKSEGSEEDGIFGLFNVNERIRLKFGEQYGITVTSEAGKGTKVTVRIPYYFES